MELERPEFGDYLLHERIGAGGMAEIFLATAQGIEGFEKRLVIKRILPNLSDDDQFVRMFIEEAKLCVTLRHPNIVQVYDLGEIDSQYFIAMEYVDGRDLLKTLAACGRKRIGFPTDIALYIVMEVLKGLQYAHQMKRPDGQPLGIIHRDVSPSNVLLSFEGEVKIGDFGIAKASTREKTATGILKGKFGYMAPEQVTGAPIDARADIFASGIVLYELLTGHRLFAGKNDLAVLERVRDAVIEPHPRYYRQDLDPELERIVMRALSREQQDRFQTAQELHDALHEYVFRSRAQVAPGHLGRFMQALFLQDQDEQARRQRVNLPAPKSLLAPPKALITGFGDESTKEERGAEPDDPPTEDASREVAAQLEASQPLRQLAQTPLPRADSVSGQAYISADEDWETEGSIDLEDGPSGLVPNRAFEESDHTDVSGDSAALIRSSVVEHLEAIDVGSGAILTSRPESLSGWIEPRPKDEVLALRKARAENDPTDFDLSGKKARSSTRSGRPPSDPVASGQPQVGQARSASNFSPAEIIERTISRTGDEGPGSEATMRFDSQPGNRLPPPSASQGKIDRTVEVEDSDLPTSEVGEAEVQLLNQAIAGTTRRDASPSPSAVLKKELIVGNVVGPPTAAGSVNPGDVTGPTSSDGSPFDEPTAGSERAPAPRLTPEDRDESATHRFDRKLSAIPAPARADSMSRRRPIPGRRERPVLLPADDDPNGLRPSRRATLGPRTSPRRRHTTRAPISVVNPGATPPAADVPGAVPRGPLPQRRDSSGVTAALSEAREIEDEIAELRKSSHDGRDDTSPGALTGGSLSGVILRDAQEPDEPTMNGEEAPAQSGVRQREARRRMTTRNVVLYGEDRGAPTPGFGEEASVPAITNAGQLDQEGASELFGVLSNLDDARDAFGPDEEVSIDTDARPYADLSESLSRVEAVTLNSEDEEPELELTAGGDEATDAELDAEEYDDTRLGTLAESTRRSPSPVRTDIEIGFTEPEEETTAALDEPRLRGEVTTGKGPPVVPRVVTPRPEGSGIMIDHELLASGGEPEERRESLTAPSNSDEMVALRGMSGPKSGRRQEPLAREDSFNEQEETTQQADEESLELKEATSNQRGGAGGDLLSESFELSLVEKEEILGPQKRKEERREERRDDERRAGRSPLDPSSSEAMSARPAAKAVAERQGEVLRAAVERNRPVKELNRAKAPPANPKRLSPTQELSPAPAVGSAGLAFQPVSATPSFGQVDPRRAAPSFGEAAPAIWIETRRTSYWTWGMYLAVMLAVMLAVAAAWVSINPHPSRTAIKPINQEPRIAAPLPPPVAPLEVPPATPPTDGPTGRSVAPPPPPLVVRSPEPSPASPPPPPAEEARAEEQPPPEAPKRRARPRPAPVSNLPVLSIQCNEPVEIRIAGQRFVDQTRFKERFKPGQYPLKIIRPGKTISHVVTLVSGQKPLTVPCE